MPRTRISSKARSKRRYYRRKRPSRLGLKRAITAVVSRSKETKRECLAWSGTLVPGTWQVQTINSLAQGDTAESRDGLQVYERGATIRYRIVGPSDRYAVLRVMLVRAKEVSLSTADLPSDDIKCINNDMKHQFQVLRDFNLTFTPRSTGSGQTGMPFSGKINLGPQRGHGKTINFTGTGIADHAAGSKLVLCLLHATNDASGTDNPDFNVDAEYRFKEK